MALQSIADQTAVGRITRIFVSENLGDRGSEAVCKEYPQLPIEYIFRDPPLDPLVHAQALMKECLVGEITCTLHDDDWWLPHHLEEALAALEANPDASLYGANLVYYAGSVLHQSLIPSDRDCDLFPWFGANYPAPAPWWRISHSNVVIATLFGLVVHYSSMAVRTAALKEAAYVYDLGNPYDNDRMILYVLSQKGPLLFNRKHSVCVRFHANRESERLKSEHNRRMCETTDWIVTSGLKSWSAIATAFVQRLLRCPDEKLHAYLIREATVRPWCLPEIARHLDRDKEKEFFAMFDKARSKFAGLEPEPDR